MAQPGRRGPPVDESHLQFLVVAIAKGWTAEVAASVLLLTGQDRGDLRSLTAKTRKGLERVRAEAEP
jgi:hypothetical protein